MQQSRRYGSRLGLIATGVLAGALGVTDAAQAASSNAPYYATPSWDQKLPATTRFVVLTDWNSEAVLDRNTGLVWEKRPDATAQTWVGARLSCLNKNVGSQMGWRLPAIVELTSLVDRSVAPGPTLPTGHPFTGVLSAIYWSATTDAENPTNVFNVVFGNGTVLPFSKDNVLQVWCVRGGMNADHY